MRIRFKSLWGKIDKDGTLRANWEELNDFCQLKRGKNVIIRIFTMPEEPSERLTNFFFGYVVKEMRNAYYEVGLEYTDSQTYDAIRKVCPVFFEETREKGVWQRREKEWEELDISEAVNAVAWIQQYAAENFQHIIDDPK